MNSLFKVTSRITYPDYFCLFNSFLICFIVSHVSSTKYYITILFYLFNDHLFVISSSSGDDAKDVRIVPIRDVLHLPLAFDHRQILSDYLAQYHAYALP